VTARRILRMAHDRGLAVARGECRVRQRLVECPSRTGNIRGVVSSLQFVTELGHIERLVDYLARSVAKPGSHSSASPELRGDLITVGRVGSRRLRALAEGLPRPEMDRGYLHGGSELRDVVDRLNRPGQRYSAATEPGHMGVATACSALAEAILMASRHAGRA
jgi:hypothetical protein